MKSLGGPVVTLAAIMALTRASKGMQEKASQDEPLVDFSVPGIEQRWSIVNDVVMGGVSRGRIVSTSGGTAVFEGDLSLENNGGFASARTVLGGSDLSKYDGLAIRVRGDGREYRIRLRDDARFDGVAYQAKFLTQPGQWMVVRIPFSEFLPTFRGRTLNDVPPVDLKNVRQLAFMVADKQAGRFRLELDWVKTYRVSGGAGKDRP